MNTNTSAQINSSKRKRTSSPISSANQTLEVNASAAHKIEFFKKKAENEEAKKFKAAKTANKYIAETVVLNSAVTEIIKICNDGIQEFTNTERVETVDEKENLATKFQNAAEKLMTESKKSRSLLTTVNHILAACNKTSECLRAKRIDNIKDEASPSKHRRSVATSSKPNTKYLKAKRKIRFSHPIANTQKSEVVTIETSDKVEIEIPFSDHGPKNDHKLTITFENNKSDEIIAKFRNKMSAETLDLSTFQISQSESELANENLEAGAKKIQSPTTYDETLAFEDTDAEISRELSTVDSDGFSDNPPQMTDECLKEHEKFKAADNRSLCFAKKRFNMKK